MGFPNPVGLAAGFDKDGEVYRQTLELGFGFVELGSVTPKPQPGNPRPRLFRLTAGSRGDQPHGLQQPRHRRDGARAATAATPARGIVGINLGKNKDQADAAGGLRARHDGSSVRCADYLVINVSSPNTPGLARPAERATRWRR